MLRSFFLGVIVAVVLCFAPSFSYENFYRYTPPPSTVGSLALFATESSAQAHCPKDQVVWLNTNTGIYHEKGMRWYGRTRLGSYVCRKEANAAGDRDTRNGQ